MRKYHPNKKNTELFLLIDKLGECNEELLDYSIRHKSNRLNKIEYNAIQIEKLAIELQKKVKEMRRK